MFREFGIMSLITWMIGFPDDDEARIKRRFAVLDEIDPDVQSLQMMLPVPGMPLYEEFAPYIEEYDLTKWDFHHPRFYDGERSIDCVCYNSGHLKTWLTHWGVVQWQHNGL